MLKKEVYARLEQAGHLNGVLPSGHGHGAIFIGDLAAFNNSKDHLRFGITAAVSCLTLEELPRTTPPSIRKHLHVPAEDEVDSQLFKYFEQVFDFVQEASRSGNVLIHCHFGISRSATVMIAYLMRRLGWALSKAYAYLKGIRDVICPNFAFCKQLIEYQKQLYVSEDWEVSDGKLIFRQPELKEVKVSQASTVASRKESQLAQKGFSPRRKAI